MILKVRIVSAFALVAPEREEYTWEGEICMADELRDAPDAEIVERLYRLFNRRDEESAAFLERMGFRLPSMSVGDLVTFHKLEQAGERHDYFRVASMGFERYVPGFDEPFPMDHAGVNS